MYEKNRATMVQVNENPKSLEQSKRIQVKEIKINSTKSNLMNHIQIIYNQEIINNIRNIYRATKIK